MSVVKLTVDNFEQEVLKAEQPVLVDFYADWCGPCQMMGPVVEEIAGEVSGAKVCTVNIDEQVEIAQRYGVMTIPTFAVFQNGAIVKKEIGALPKNVLKGMLNV